MTTTVTPFATIVSRTLAMEHGVGDVVDVELVETEHTDSIDDVIQCHAHRAEFMRPRVQICKEPMKVNAPLADREPVVELVP